MQISRIIVTELLFSKAKEITLETKKDLIEFLSGLNVWAGKLGTEGVSVG